LFCRPVGTLPVDHVVEQVLVAEVLDHRLLVVEPLDIGPSLLGEPRRMTTWQLRFRHFEQHGGEARSTEKLRPLDGERPEQDDVRHRADVVQHLRQHNGVLGGNVGPGAAIEPRDLVIHVHDVQG
jgi:hypothetical protein